MSFDPKQSLMPIIKPLEVARLLGDILARGVYSMVYDIPAFIHLQKSQRS